MEYDIIYWTSPSELIGRVNEKIKEGFTLIWWVATETVKLRLWRDTRFYQAVVMNTFIYNPDSGIKPEDLIK